MTEHVGPRSLKGFQEDPGVLDVPSAVFRRGQRGPLGELLVALRQLPALALGPPFWIQVRRAVASVSECKDGP